MWYILNLKGLLNFKEWGELIGMVLGVWGIMVYSRVWARGTKKGVRFSSHIAAIEVDKVVLMSLI